MKCPHCQSDTTRVIDTNPTVDNSMRKRRHRCNACHKSFASWQIEETEFNWLLVALAEKIFNIRDRMKIKPRHE